MAGTKTDEQKEAVEWMRRCTRINFSSDDEFVRHRATILAMLAEPRLPRPEDVPEHVLEKMWWATAPNGSHFDVARAAYRALYDHYTAPRTKTVEVWRVEFAERHHVTGDWLPCTETWPTEDYIRRKEDDLRGRSDVACVKVTGPHQQEVPDDAR